MWGMCFLAGLVNTVNAILNNFQRSVQINARVQMKLVLLYVVEMVNVIVVFVSVI